MVQLELGEDFPEDPKAQLWGAIGAVSGPGSRRAHLISLVSSLLSRSMRARKVFNSWMNQRAKTYRHLIDSRILVATGFASIIVVWPCWD